MNLVRAYWRCGPVVIGTAAISFSFTALAIKFLGDAVPPFETVSASGLLCLTALTGILWQKGLRLLPRPDSLDVSPSSIHLLTAVETSSSLPCDRPPPVSMARVVLLTLLRGTLGSMATTAFILSLALLSLKDAVTLFFTSPVIALLLDWLLMSRSPGWPGAAATALTLAGALLVTQPPFLFSGGGASGGSGGPHSPHGSVAAGVWGDGGGGDDGVGGARGGGSLSSLGAALALLAAGANASGFLTISLLRGHQHPLVLTWWYNLVLTLMTVAPLALRWPQPPVLPSSREALLLLAVGVTQLAAQLCLNRGFQLEPPGRGAAINVLQVLFSFVLDVAVLGNKPSLLSVGGSSLVAAGVLFVAVSSSSKEGDKHTGAKGEGDGILAFANGAVRYCADESSAGCASCPGGSGIGGGGVEQHAEANGVAPAALDDDPGVTDSLKSPLLLFE